jgi:hypothetical protein
MFWPTICAAASSRLDVGAIRSAAAAAIQAARSVGARRETVRLRRQRDRQSDAPEDVSFALRAARPAEAPNDGQRRLRRRAPLWAGNRQKSPAAQARYRARFVQDECRAFDCYCLVWVCAVAVAAPSGAHTFTTTRRISFAFMRAVPRWVAVFCMSVIGCDEATPSPIM